MTMIEGTRPLSILTPLLANAEIVQVCYIVDNLERECERFHQFLGIGPFLGGKKGVLDSHVYRGKAAPPIGIRGVFVQSGAIVIELVELVSDTPSAFHDMYPDGGHGVHHVAVFARDYETERDAIAAAGYPVVSEFTTRIGAKICYLDTRPLLGHMLELYPEDPAIRAMYRRTREAAENWDGRHLIMPW